MPSRNGLWLGVHVNETPQVRYGDGFARAAAAGSELESLALNWTDLEPEPGRLRGELLEIADAFYPSRGTRLILVVRPLDTNGMHLPPDLKGRAIDEAAVIDRFGRLLTFLRERMPRTRLHLLSLGNEVDASLGGDAVRWAAYTRFFQASAAQARRLWPGVPVGVCATFGGLVGAAREELAGLNAAADAVLVNYYPLRPDFTVRPPETVAADFARLVRLYPKRPIHVTEAGCPSSAVCGSSEAQQAAFVRALFRAWDRHRAQVRTLHFDWLNDLTGAQVDGFTRYYGLATAPFKEYLRTLGLCTAGGTPKPALRLLAREAKARGWKTQP